MIDINTIEPGLPVEIGRIDKELGKLWESNDDTKTRASLINLVVYSEDAQSLAANTEIVAAIAGQHACRAILILANPHAKTSGARAWISAHCHFSGKGGRQICSEQITFRLDGDSTAALPNIVFSHLDSDLPLCFWWQAAFREPLDEKLWAWTDRLIFDSTTWANPETQFALTQKIGSLTDANTVLCDLNWTRLYSWRFALASLFDHAAALPCLARINCVRMTCGPNFRTTALLLLGWIAAQLGWKLQSLLDKNFFINPAGIHITFDISEISAAGLSSVELTCENACFQLYRVEGSEFFHATLQAPGTPKTVSTLGAGREKITDVLLAELSRGGRHPLYAKSLAAVQQLLIA